MALEGADPPGRHEVDEQRELVVEDQDRHLADAPGGGDAPAHEILERRVEGPHGDHAGRRRRLDAGADQGRSQASHGDLDLRQLGHRAPEARADGRR
jgi:hypothetical protein